MKFGDFKVYKIEDLWDRKPIVSETDRKSKDVLVFHVEPSDGYQTLKVTVRPSGTEPKTKFYIEIGTAPFDMDEFEKIKVETEQLVKSVEKSFMDHCFKLINIDFPERGYLLFWQLPIYDKMRYFEIEGDIEQLVNITDKKEKEDKLNEILEFLGTDPEEKVNKAFSAKYNASIREYIKLDE